MASRAEKLRDAAKQRRRMAIIERIYAPQFAREVDRATTVAANDYSVGGMQSLDVGRDEHVTNMRELLSNLYGDATRLAENYSRDKFGKKLMGQVEKKDAMAQALEALSQYWLQEAFTMSVFISETTYNDIRKLTERSVREGLGEVEISKQIREYANLISPGRARTIARTETHQAVMKSQYDIVDSMELPEYVNEWASGSDGRVRDDHRRADGELRMPGQPFQIGKDKLMFPGDRNGSKEQVINCLLPHTPVSFCHPKKLFRRRYVGEVINIELDGFPKLSVTPNHPILTDVGFKSAHLVNEGDNLIVDTRVNSLGSMDIDVDGVNATVGELFDSVIESGNRPRSTGGVVDFHGDVSDSDVEIVDVSGALMNGVESHESTTKENILFKLSETIGSILVCDSAIDKFLFAALDPSHSVVSSFGDFLSLLRGCILESDDVGLTSRASLEAELLQTKIYCDAIHAESFTHFEDGELLIIKGLDFINDSFPNLGDSNSKLLEVVMNAAFADSENITDFFDAFPLIKELLCSFLSLSCHSMTLGSKVVRSSFASHYDGFVYNIEDEKVFYNAAGIINHNCRCVLVQSFDEDDIRAAQ